MNNKKIVMWVLVALVVVGGGYFVFKNSGSLNKGVNPKSQTAWYNISLWGNGTGCTLTNAHGTYTGKVIFKDGQQYCKLDINDVLVNISAPGVSVDKGGPVGQIDPNFNAQTAVLYTFGDKPSEKNFFDWSSFDTKTCIGSADDANKYYNDEESLNKFINDSSLNTDQVKPWTGASDACYKESILPDKAPADETQAPVSAQ